MSPRTGLSRRALLKGMAAGASAAWVPTWAQQTRASTGQAFSWPESGAAITDEGWRLWVDAKAHWENDEIFLPEEVEWIDGTLCGRKMPLQVNPPSGGWPTLTNLCGKSVTLPTSVEQHFWGIYGAGADGRPRSYTPEEYRYGPAHPPVAPADDAIPQNGAYNGVSWFYRSIAIAEEMRGKQILLHVRGAHLRAEVYLNGQLCGYSIMEELPFSADLTNAARPGGENLLAIRITNPFGRFDWVDGSNAKWGKVSLFRSHGFGALDRGITISAHDSIRFRDVWVLNQPQPDTVTVYGEVEGDGEQVDVHFEVADPSTREKMLEIPGSLTMSATGRGHQQGVSRFSGTLRVPDAKFWDIGAGKLYHLRATVKSASGKQDARTVAFGFRSFRPTGIGSNAMLRLNGRRIRIYTAISWGFWGLNGMFPVPELAEKEVVAAQKLGLNCLNFHRNLAKEDVLRKHDELGVLRYMEPGGGRLSIGRLPAGEAPNSASVIMEKPANDAEHFAQRFMFTKCVEMVRAFRSHPSVIEYCLQNEIGADLNNPATLAVLKAMHDEDPSRCVVLNDGFVARGAAQAWYEPWNEQLKEGKLHRSDQEKAGGWWINHQGAGDQWLDQFYKSPAEYTYKAPYADVITEFGEMEGCARPDNHPLIVHQVRSTYAKYGGNSYHLADHEAIIAGYDRFLDRWGFRQSFAASECVFKATGQTCYESWMNYMENARISNELDFAAISGWESTSIENHSGIVDNLRNFKGDPELIRGSLLPIRPIAKQRALVVERGKSAVFDLYLANDTPQPATGTLTLSMVTPSGKKEDLLKLPAPEQQADVFSYLLKVGFVTPRLNEDGLYRFRFTISSNPAATQTKELWVTGIPEQKCGARLQIAVSGIKPALRAQLIRLSQAMGCFEVVEFNAGERYQAIISAGMTASTRDQAQIGETTGEQMPVTKPGSTAEPVQTSEGTQLGTLAPGILDAVRAGTALLAIPQADTLADGLARELAAAGAFTYNGAVGNFRAPWMGNWYFVREHALFKGMPTGCAFGAFYQVTGRQSNGLLIDRAPGGPEVEVIVGYSRDHDRNVGAGTFASKVGKGKMLFHRVPPMHFVMDQRFLANALLWLTD